MKRWKKRINDIFAKSAKAPLETVVLDVKTEDPVRFKDNAEELWKLVSAMEGFECKDLTAVKTELDKKNEMVNNLLEEVERLKKLAGIKVRFACFQHCF